MLSFGAGSAAAAAGGGFTAAASRAAAAVKAATAAASATTTGALTLCGKWPHAVTGRTQGSAAAAATAAFTSMATSMGSVSSRASPLVAPHVSSSSSSGSSSAFSFSSFPRARSAAAAAAALARAPTLQAASRTTQEEEGQQHQQQRLQLRPRLLLQQWQWQCGSPVGARRWLVAGSPLPVTTTRLPGLLLLGSAALGARDQARSSGGNSSSSSSSSKVYTAMTGLAANAAWEGRMWSSGTGATAGVGAAAAGVDRVVHMMSKVTGGAVGGASWGGGSPGYAPPPPPPSSSSSPSAGNVFVDYTFYKGKAAMTIKPIRPVFRRLPKGSYALAKEGTLFLSFAPARGSRLYDWDRKQVFSLSVAEMGRLCQLQPNDRLDFFHDPNMNNRDRGKVQKVLKVEPSPDQSGFFFQLTVKDDVAQINESVSIKMLHSEFAILRTVMNFIMPYCLGWNVFVDPKMLISSMVRIEDDGRGFDGGDGGDRGGGGGMGMGGRGGQY